MSNFFGRIYVLDLNAKRLIQLFDKTKSYDMTKHKIWKFIIPFTLVICLRIVSNFEDNIALGEGFGNFVISCIIVILLEYIILTIIANIIMRRTIRTGQSQDKTGDGSLS